MPPGSRTRPTTDRVREALFSAVASWAGTAAQPPETALKGLAFCDLFAGSGAVGLEAASRGAGPVVLVEGDRRTAEVARANASALGLDVTVRAARVEQLLEGPPPACFDVLFADPPYELESDYLGTLLVRLVGGGWLRSDGLVVIERSVRSAPFLWPDAITDRWSREYGETVLQYGQP